MKALRNADSAGDTQAATRIAAMIRAEQQQPTPTPEESGRLTNEEVLMGGIQEPVRPVPRETSIDEDIMAGATELAAGINRGVYGAVDFFTTDQINALLQISGSEKRVPTLTEEFGVPPGTFVGGQTGRALSAAGEVIPAAVGVGALLRKGAQQLPALAEAGESVTRGIARQLGKTTAAADIGYGGISGAGAQIGEEEGGDTGALVGSFLAPVAATTVKSAVGGLLNLGKRGFQSLMGAVEGMSDDGAATLLAESMVRSGLGPDDIVKQLESLGPEAIPADASNNFARLLRLASNKIPRIEGQAAEVFQARKSGQGNRILQALDDATGTPSLTLDDEIIRLEKTVGPEVNALYEAARAKPIVQTTKLKGLLEGKSSVGKARQAAESRLEDRRALGEQVSDIDIIDATKQELDDQIGTAIRQGQNNKARDLVRLKNTMVDEADKVVPEYKQARDMFAGKATLENAADSGSLFLKMNPRDVNNITKTMGESEKKMFKLGAKQAIVDRIDSVQLNADLVKRLFGKGGDVKKLRTLFDDKESFDRFSDTLEKEAQFVLTRREAQANSTTAKQLFDEGAAVEVFGNAIDAVSTPTGAARVLGRVIGGLQAKKRDDAFIKALEEVGDLLLAKGTDPQKIRALLKSGSAKRIESVFRNAIKKELKPGAITPSTIAALRDRETPETQ